MFIEHYQTTVVFLETILKSFRRFGGFVLGCGFFRFVLGFFRFCCWYDSIFLVLTMAVKRILMVSVNLISNDITGMIYAKVLISHTFCTWLGDFLGVYKAVSGGWDFFWWKCQKQGKVIIAPFTDFIRWTYLPTGNWTKFHLLFSCSSLNIW